MGVILPPGTDDLPELHSEEHLEQAREQLARERVDQFDLLDLVAEQADAPGPVLVVGVEAVAHFREVETCCRTERFAHLGDRPVEGGDLAVDLHPIAGGDDHPLVHVVAAAQRLVELGTTVTGQGGALQQFDGCRTV